MPMRLTTTIVKRYSDVGAAIGSIEGDSRFTALEDQMKKYAAALAAALLALLGVTALAPSAQAYPFPPPGVTLTLHLNLNRVVSGHTFVATAKASVNCTSLKINWDGQSGESAGATFKHQFRAPIVTTNTVIRAYAFCTYTATSGTAGHAISLTPKTLTAHADITVIPVGSGNGHLPNTGGPSVGWLIGGIAALLAGALAMYVGRRRDTDTATL